MAENDSTERPALDPNEVTHLIVRTLAGAEKIYEVDPDEIEIFAQQVHSLMSTSGAGAALVPVTGARVEFIGGIDLIQSVTREIHARMKEAAAVEMTRATLAGKSTEARPDILIHANRAR